MNKVQIRNISHPLSSPLEAIYCRNFLCRLRGLMFRHSLSRQEGLLLVEGRESRVDASIHMFFVFFDLAVIWLDAKKVVVDVALARSWHPFYAPRQPASHILEIHAQRLNEFTPGDHLEF